MADLDLNDPTVRESLRRKASGYLTMWTGLRRNTTAVELARGLVAAIDVLDDVDGLAPEPLSDRGQR